MNAKASIKQKFFTGELAGKTLDEIVKALSLPYREKGRLEPILEDLKLEGIYVDSDGKYGTAEQLGLIRGTLSGNERGFAFLIPDDRDAYPKDLFIPHKSLFGAMHKDVVLAERVYGGKREDEGCVVEILERGFKEIVGTFYKDKKCGTLCPDDKKYFENIYIPLSACKNISDGVKAVAKITDYPLGRAPGGEIIEVLGNEEDFFAEELSIIRSYSLKEEFSDRIISESEKVSRVGIRPADLISRTDYRDKKIITIDGEDTRDIDDAISLEKEGENYVLGVHIADVSHYVKYLSPLDKEAFDRGTSVYFPDRVLPMLPRALSNGICSLNEGEDRLALSCIMTIDQKGSVKKSEIVQSVIRSTHRMTYTEVSAILEGDKETSYQFSDVKDMIFLCKELTNILKTMRDKKGSVELDVKEAHILFDGENIEIPDYHRPFSYEIIEQFMVIANETVAEYMHSIDAPFVYRIHEKPNEEKAETFRAFAQSLGLRAKFSTEDIKPYEFSTLLKEAKDLPVFPVLNRTMLRSMQKARYSPVNVGHFGLASDCYCHFTSPIRRYPDLCIHRIIKEVINGGYNEACEKYAKFVGEASIQSSEREKRATEAEREVDALYMTIYMSEHIGEEFNAVISGIANFGIFAELPNTVEGFIPVETLEGEFEYIPERFLLKGTKQSYTIGEQVKIKVEDVDFYERRTRFSLIKEIKE